MSVKVGWIHRSSARPVRGRVFHEVVGALAGWGPCGARAVGPVASVQVFPDLPLVELFEGRSGDCEVRLFLAFPFVDQMELAGDVCFDVQGVSLSFGRRAFPALAGRGGERSRG